MGLLILAIILVIGMLFMAADIRSHTEKHNVTARPMRPSFLDVIITTIISL